MKAEHQRRAREDGKEGRMAKRGVLGPRPGLKFYRPPPFPPARGAAFDYNIIKPKLHENLKTRKRKGHPSKKR